MSDYTRVVNAADAWGSVPLTACGWCGVFVADPHLHDRWCPGKEHERMLEGYSQVFNFDAKEVADGLREYALRKVAEDLEALPPDHDVYNPGVPLDHKEP